MKSDRVKYAVKLPFHLLLKKKKKKGYTIT